MPLALERENLPANEAVADRRIPINQIGNFHWFDLELSSNCAMGI